MNIHELELAKAIEVIAPRFRSGNSVQVDKAWVPKSEWDAMLVAIAALLMQPVPVVNERAVILAADALCGEWNVHGADSIRISEFVISTYLKELSSG